MIQYRRTIGDKIIGISTENPPTVDSPTGSLVIAGSQLYISQGSSTYTEVGSGGGGGGSIVTADTYSQLDVTADVGSVGMTRHAAYILKEYSHAIDGPTKVYVPYWLDIDGDWTLENYCRPGDDDATLTARGWTGHDTYGTGASAVITPGVSRLVTITNTTSTTYYMTPTVPERYHEYFVMMDVRYSGALGSATTQRFFFYLRGPNLYPGGKYAFIWAVEGANASNLSDYAMGCRTASYDYVTPGHAYPNRTSSSYLASQIAPVGSTYPTFMDIKACPHHEVSSIPEIWYQGGVVRGNEGEWVTSGASVISTFGPLFYVGFSAPGASKTAQWELGGFYLFKRIPTLPTPGE